MELRIYCSKGNCQNMIKKNVQFGSRIKDIIYVHGWIEKPGMGPVCNSCWNLDFEMNPVKYSKIGLNLYKKQ
jgi:hypothetical protein